MSTLLQPAFEAKDTLVRKADAIFEKEQALLLESTGSRESLGKKPTLYINDNGYAFLYARDREEMLKAIV